MAKPRASVRRKPGARNQTASVTDRLGFFWLTLFAVTAAVAFSPGLRGPFVFDDIQAIRQNATIRQLLPLGVPLHPPSHSPVSGRPVVNFSLAINYAIAGPHGQDATNGGSTFGYHVFNVLIHIACAALLFGVVRRSLRRWRGDEDAASAAQLAGFTGLLWLLHPIQTEAVNYVIQRTELLVSLFYLGTLYASIRAWDASTSRRRWWYALATLMCALGMGSKEVMITAPVIVVLYDRCFHFDTWSELIGNRPRMRFYAALLLTSMLVVLPLISGARGGAGFDEGVTWYQYLYTQCWAIGRYLRLLVWPVGLTFDYGEVRSVGARAIPGLVVLIACAGIATVMWRRPRHRWIGFLGAWFFCLLAPSSSIVPIKTEIAAERRVYLASAAVIVLAVLGIDALRRRFRFDVRAQRLGLGLLASVLLVLTYTRSRVYADAEALYRDAIVKTPENPRAYAGLGLVLAEQGPHRIAEAIGVFHRALEVDSSYFVAWRSLGVLALAQGHWREAVDPLGRALRLQPGNLGIAAGLARAHIALRSADSAMKYVSQIGAADPDLLWSLGALLVEQGRGSAAVPFLEAAANGDPSAAGLGLLSVAYAQDGRVDQAVLAARVATASAGDTAQAFELAGRAMLIAHRRDEARGYLNQALLLDSTSTFARQTLREMNAGDGRPPR